MNIAIYLGPFVGDSVDATNVENGNPGVGGTQYCMLQLAHYLNSKDGYRVHLFASREYIVEDGIAFKYISGDDGLCAAAADCHSDILILSQFNNHFLELDIAKQQFKVIVWSHNYILSSFCHFISNTRQVYCNVFVGKQQYDRYLDDDVIKKSVYIYNMFSDNSLVVGRNNDCKTVVYMGAIIPGKGFLELCSIWHKILQEVPEAQLLVLGSGKLYGDARLGKLGIADDKYEKQFSQFICDHDGNVIPSVHFLGVVGEEKKQIFQNASVGVVNPSGRTETFGMGVLEMAEMTLPVVTVGRNGYFDTVIDKKTGFLAHGLEEVATDIIRLLKNPLLNERMGLSAKDNNKRFAPDLIGQQWEILLKDIFYDRFLAEPTKASVPYSNNQKWIRILLRIFRFNLRLKFIPSLVQMESLVYKFLRK